MNAPEKLAAILGETAATSGKCINECPYHWKSDEAMSWRWGFYNGLESMGFYSRKITERLR